MAYRSKSVRPTPTPSAVPQSDVEAGSPQQRSRRESNPVQHPVAGDQALSGDTRNILHHRPLPRRGGPTGKDLVGEASLPVHEREHRLQDGVKPFAPLTTPERDNDEWATEVALSLLPLPSLCQRVNESTPSTKGAHQMATMLIPSFALSIQEAALELGVCQETIENLIKRRQLSAFKVGRLVRIKRDSLDEFAILNGVTPRSPTQIQATVSDTPTTN